MPLAPRIQGVAPATPAHHYETIKPEAPGRYVEEFTPSFERAVRTVETRDRAVPGPASSLFASRYRVRAGDTLPLVVFFHGGAGRMSDANDTIFLIDEIELRAEVTEEFLAAFRARYLPVARQRGMELQHTWITPPEGPPGVGPTILLVWGLAGVPGFWRMRSQTDAPGIAEWWRECKQYCVRRTRRFAVAAEAREDFSAAGRRHA